MNNCCLHAVPHSDSSFETLARPVADWMARLTAGLTHSVQASDQTLGHLEEEILHQTRAVERAVLERAGVRFSASIAAFDAAPDAGVVALDGEMLDLPHLKRAKRLLDST